MQLNTIQCNRMQSVAVWRKLVPSTALWCILWVLVKTGATWYHIDAIRCQLCPNTLGPPSLFWGILVRGIWVVPGSLGVSWGSGHVFWGLGVYEGFLDESWRLSGQSWPRVGNLRRVLTPSWEDLGRSSGAGNFRWASSASCSVSEEFGGHLGGSLSHCQRQNGSKSLPKWNPNHS